MISLTRGLLILTVKSTLVILDTHFTSDALTANVRSVDNMLSELHVGVCQQQQQQQHVGVCQQQQVDHTSHLEMVRNSLLKVSWNIFMNTEIIDKQCKMSRNFCD